MFSYITWCLGLVALLSAGFAAGAAEDPIVARSLVSMGDTARLQAVLAKARAGQAVTVGVLGGSITQGASASSEEHRYGNLMAKWWRDTFPKSKIEFVNAGIGATGSDIGAHRVRRHLLEKHPDFVVVEYAVNDAGSPIAAETLEGVVRQILSEPNHPAVMLLFMMDKRGANVQDVHIPIGRRYGLPMVSFHDALWPEVQEKRIPWESIEADEVHPNDRGHAYAASFVTHVLEQLLAKLPKEVPPVAAAPLPSPEVSDLFEHTALLSADTLKPVRNEGWQTFTDPAFGTFFGAGWKATAPGSVMEFEAEGTAFSVLFYRVKGATGIAEAQVDDGKPARMDAWFEATWGGYTPFQLAARDLKPGKHKVRITLIEDKNPGSTGHEFRVYALLCAGVPGK